MKPLNSVHFIDALAEITSHNDREIIERSLLATLSEYHSAKEHWLYQVLTVMPELSLGLLAYSSSSGIVVSEHAVRQKLPTQINESVIQAIQESKVISTRSLGPSKDTYMIFPAVDRNGDVFAVLIERAKSFDLESQRLVHGFLRIYSNYLRLLEQARRDKLTGLLNRETLENEITRIIILNNEKVPPGFEMEPEVDNDVRQHKGELKYWLGVLDIDHFKRINDNYGHLYGDEVLILVSRLMESCVRGYDLIFRYGGEEFVILLKAFDLNDAKLAFERIRTTVGHHDYAKVEQVTVSIGVTEVAMQSGSTEVIEQADEALYFAKEHGRDQVQFYEVLIDQGLIKPPVQEVETGGVNFF